MGFVAARTAAVDAFAQRNPKLAQRLWPDHPEVALASGFAAIGTAAGQGRAPPPSAFEAVHQAARRAPLAAEPFLVRGVRAQVAGETVLAERAFAEARRRDPRSRAARYFLAELYLRNGRIGDSLREIAALSRLVPGSGAQLAPYLARFAADPSTLAEMRALFRSEHGLGNAVLGELARDPANARLIVALAEGVPTADGSWRGQLLDGLLAAGRFAEARETWSRLSQRPPPDGLVDPDFRGSDSPAPFNWTYASGPGGLAEPKDGELHVLYFGRENAVLASQLVMLAPGTYRLDLTVSGAGDSLQSLNVSLNCLPAGSVLARLPLKPGRLSARFRVAGDCPAQRLELAGVAPDTPSEVEARISGLTLARVQGQ